MFRILKTLAILQGKFMGLNKSRVVLPGLSLAFSLLLTALGVSGCFSTEPATNGMTKIQNAVLPSVQRLVHENPFAQDRNDKVTGDNNIPTHVVNLRHVDTALSYRLVRTGHGATCTDPDDQPYASFESLLSVDPLQTAVQLIGDPCHPGENTALPNFDIKSVQFPWMGLVARNRFANLNGKLYWVISPKMGMDDIVRLDEVPVLACTSEGDGMGIFAIQTTALENLHHGDGLVSVWAMMAVRRGDEGNSYLATRYFPMTLETNDLAVIRAKDSHGRVDGYIVRPQADGTAPAYFRMPKLAGLNSESKEKIRLNCIVNMPPSSDSLQIANE